MKLTELSFQQQASHWGRIFEIAVQRGVLGYLIHQELVFPDHPSLVNWQDIKVFAITQSLIQVLGITDTEAKEWVKSGVNHLMLLGYGLGWSTVREWLKSFNFQSSRYQLESIWCPLFLPSDDLEKETERIKTAQAFQASFPQLYPPPFSLDLDLISKGQPGRADFLLWLTPIRSNSLLDQILCLELSYNMPPNPLNDYREETAHCQEILRHANFLESRGVFAKVCAEVQGEMLDINSKIASFLNAFSSRDKPFYKLCQASAYTNNFVRLLRNHNRLSQGCHTTAIAVTGNGLESLRATFGANGKNEDPRVQLMQTLGDAYIQRKPLKDDNPQALQEEVRGVFRTLLNSLPKNFKQQVKPLIKSPPLTQDFHLDIQETVENFYQPMQPLAIQTALENIEVTPALKSFFIIDPKQAICQVLAEKAQGSTEIPLREVHAATIIAGLKNTPIGEMRAIALEGNPGIGKTTAVVDFLHQHTQGFVFLYVSPRVVINRDVTNKLAHDSDKKLTSGIVTMTSNSDLINAAPKWYREQPNVNKSLYKDGAVVVDGDPALRLPQNNTVYLNPIQEEEINIEIVRSRRQKQSLSERTDRVTSRPNPGVLRTLAKAAQNLLQENPQINRLAITAAIQGYRRLGSRTTIDALSGIFKHKADSKLGKQEREKFAQRIPSVIVMVDEIAGDGAGALFCRDLANWLKQEFLKPFGQGQSPFRIIMILADASLSNEVVLERYLNSEELSPDKVLISPSQSNSRPFWVTGTYLKVGNGKALPTLHVMTNSFPATNLTIDYRIRLSALTSENKGSPPFLRIHQLIQQQKDTELLNSAFLEIQKALTNGAKQIIFFAQDKRFLRELKQKLICDLDPRLLPTEIEILDQSTAEKKRIELVQSPKREQVKVFLLTSSGSRGVSFPKTDHIIAFIPRFHIEASLMEVAQLIYRGRGIYYDYNTEKMILGDNTKRKLVLLIQDFFLQRTESSEEEFARQWLRKTSDLLTLLVMLRSTIHTRIKGDADLQRKRLAFVPVGRVGDEEILNLMADDVAQFIYEANIFVKDLTVEDLKGVIELARQEVEALFRCFDLTGKSAQAQTISYSDYQSLEALSKTICSGYLLVGNTNTQKRDKHLVKPNNLHWIPDNIYCFGPYWIETWEDHKIQEQFNFDVKIADLLRLLGVIKNHQKIPIKLRRSAEELYKLLARDQENKVQEYATLQSIQSQNLVIALPLDYPHFWQAPDDTGRYPTIVEPTIWRGGFGRCLTNWGMVLPVISQYQNFPWAAVIDKQALYQIQALFNNHYFINSYELNLLNIILLEDIIIED